MAEQKRDLAFLVSALAAVTAAGFGVFWLLAQRYPCLFALGILAYLFGLRHAVDADHIAAIDNTTRKLIHDGRRPLTVGLYFSLGHSTIVLLLSFALAVAAGATQAWLPRLEAVGSVVGTTISAIFLFLIAGLNLVILKDLYQVFHELRSAPITREKAAEMEALLLQRGLLSRVLGKAYAAVHSEKQMYLVGLLFGLGFDTASEIALLGMSAFAAGKGMPVAAILILPTLFAIGMCLVDTLDGVLMQYAYAWALLHPIRKVYYNLTVTTVSIMVAVGVGTVECLQVMGTEMSLQGPFWSSLQALNFETLGWFVIGLLLASWGISVAVYRLKGYEARVV